MWKLIKYSFLVKIRDFSLVFWPFIFPLVLTTAMDFSIGQMVLCNYYGWALALVMLFSILTGWGRAPGASRKEH